jgi:membrane fusion protein (multidrug efflux system)
MKNILMVLAAAIIVVSCSAPAAAPENEGAKREQLQQYKQELHALKQKIEDLETELSSGEKDEVVKVKVAELNTELFEHFIEVTGNVEAEQDVDVSPETAGVIMEVYVKEGDQVSKGKVLAKLNTDILERSMDELLVQLDLAKINFERQDNLWKQNIGSEMQYLQAKNTKEGLEKRIESLKAQMAMAKIKSPLSGVVDVVYQKKGHIGNPQVPFAKVINMSKMKVYADVSEAYLTKVKKGDKIGVTFPALSRQMEAPIVQIGNSIDANNRTFRVRINLDNADKMIKPNLVSIIKIRDYYAEDAIVIPSLYIKEDFKGSYTYIVEGKSGKSTAKKIYITPGVTNNNMTEIKEGLSAGTKIISEGFNQIVDGTSLQF